MCVFCVSAKVLNLFCTSARRFLEIKDVLAAGNGFSSAILVECRRAGDHAQGVVPGVDTWELWRIFGHVAKVFKNEKRMVADLVERVDGGHLAKLDVLPSRTCAFFRFSVALWFAAETTGPARPEVCSSQSWRSA